MTDTASASASETRPPAGGDHHRLRALEEQARDLDRRVENNRVICDTWTLIIFVIAAVALLASIIAVGFGMRAIDEADQHVAADLTTAAGVLT